MLAGGQLQMICPQAEFRLEGAPYSYAPMFTWMKRGPNDRPIDGELERVAGALSTFIDEVCQRYDVDTKRLVLMGFSQGGFLAYRLALSEPQRWQGAAMLSTWLSDDAADDVHPDAAELPLLVQHGINDPLVEIDKGRNSRDQLQAMRMNLTYREYSMQHEIGRESIHDLSAWLSERLLSERTDD
jgi:phospholipase/carboxylesterase